MFKQATAAGLVHSQPQYHASAIPCLSASSLHSLLCSSHLDVEDDDPNLGANFSIEKLRESQEGLHTIPSTVHGAPVSAQVLSFPSADAMSIYLFFIRRQAKWEVARSDLVISM